MEVDVEDSKDDEERKKRKGERAKQITSFCVRTCLFPRLCIYKQFIKLRRHKIVSSCLSCYTVSKSWPLTVRYFWANMKWLAEVHRLYYLFALCILMQKVKLLKNPKKYEI